MMSRRILAALGLTLAVTLVAGCGSKPAPGGPPATPEPAAPTTTFHWYIGTNLTSFDPALISDSDTAKTMQNVYSGLLTQNETGEIQMGIAAKYTVTDGGKTYTFTLKDGVTFSNGDPVTASDFRWSMMRAANPNLASPTVFSYLDDITGFATVGAAQAKANAPVRKLKSQIKAKTADVKANKAPQSELDALNAQLADAQKAAETANTASWADFQKDPGIEAPDAKTLVIHLAKPVGYFLGKLAYNTGWVLDQKVAPADKPIAASPDNLKLVVGTGPFLLKDWVDNSAATLVRNPNFYGDKAKVGTVDIQVIKAVATAFAKYQSGELDVSAVPPADYPRVKSDGTLSKELTEKPRASVGYFALNENKYLPSKDVHVRQAFNYALDHDAMVKVVYNNSVLPAYGILPAGIPGALGDSLKGLKYDPTKAKELLKQAGYDDSKPLPPITLTYAIGDTNQKLGEFMQQQFQTNLGVKVTLEPQEFGTMLQRQNARTELDTMFLGWGADYLDPQNFLSTLLTCDSEYNRYGYCNKDLDAKLAQADVMAPGADRNKIYSDVEQAMVDEAAWVPLNFGKLLYLAKPYIKGYRTGAMGALPFNTVEIAAH